MVGLTAAMMVIEIAAGLWTGSMALLADGIHMVTHAGALGVAAFAYWYAKRHVGDPHRGASLRRTPSHTQGCLTELTRGVANPGRFRATYQDYPAFG